MSNEVLKVVRNQGKSTVLTLEPKLVRALNIATHTYASQTLFGDGILLKFHKLDLSGTTATNGNTNSDKKE
jgi:hypothetical protein